VSRVETHALSPHRESARSQRPGRGEQEGADRATSVSGPVLSPGLLSFRSLAGRGERRAGAEAPAVPTPGRPGAIPQAGSRRRGPPSPPELLVAARLLFAGQAAVGRCEARAAALLLGVSERKSVSVTKIRHEVLYFFVFLK